MVKRPLVIPTVRVVHVCPPIVVHTNLSDFRAVVQELTGRVIKNTTIVRSSSNEHFDSSPFMQIKSNKEDGSCPLANDSSMSACTCDHQNNHTKSAPPYHAAASSSYKNGALLDSVNACTVECNDDCCADKNGILNMVDEPQVWPYEDCLDGLTKIDDEVCINEVSVLSSPNWTAPSSYGNCMSNKREGDHNMECIAEAWTDSGQLSELVIYPESTSCKSERRPAKKSKPIHQESRLDHQHLVYSNIIPNSVDSFPPNEENIAGFITPHSSLFPSHDELEYLHADFYHHLLQNT